MQLEVRFFAAIREQVARESEAVELPEGASVADLVAALQVRFPAVAGLLARSRVAQEDAFVAPDGGLVAGPADIIPPVSGG